MLEYYFLKKKTCLFHCEIACCIAFLKQKISRFTTYKSKPTSGYTCRPITHFTPFCHEPSMKPSCMMTCIFQSIFNRRDINIPLPSKGASAYYFRCRGSPRSNVFGYTKGIFKLAARRLWCCAVLKVIAQINTHGLQ